MLAGASLQMLGIEPDGYYKKCENLSGAALLTALQNTVGSHTTISYDGLWDVYKTSDITPSGLLWDMYSTKQWPTESQRCGNYQKVGDCVNREHSFPKSWFSNGSPMVSDAYHIYPTDGKVNGQRSNYPYGECAAGSTLGSNGGVQALGKLGKSTFSGYTGTVFEPVDEYKGDFARSYFYMAAAYNNRIASWSSDMLAGNAFPAFTPWAVNLLLKWHRQDPVSQKELDRNEAVYAWQKNRNPFIDHPELAEYIWGNNATEPWTLSAGGDPAIVLPANGSEFDFGTVGVNTPRTANLTVKTSGVTVPVQISVAGAGFATSTTQISAQQACAGTSITLTCTAKTEGNISGTLTLTAGNLKTTVTLTAQAFSGLPASQPTEIGTESFMAHWVYVGGADSNGCYTLDVLQNGQSVDTYPRSVKAADEEYLVDELLPETTYSYTISCGTLTSRAITVTTATPQPSVQFMYEGNLALTTTPGIPSDAVELLLDIENINQDITITVTQPFELSTDKINWATGVTISPEADRLYLRVNSATAGMFTTCLTVTAGSYTDDDTEVTATVAEDSNFLEDFEAKGQANYDGGAYNGTAGKWMLKNAGVFAIAKEAGQGSSYLRMGKDSSSSLTLNQDVETGIGTVSFLAGAWANDGEAVLNVDCSTDGGQTWTTAARVTLPASSQAIGNNYKEYTVTVAQPGKARLRLQQTSGSRLGIDNLMVTGYSGGLIDGVESNYHQWDAYCLDHALVVELQTPQTVSVYGTDGRTYALRTMPEGKNALLLPQGLYIVVVNDFSRRVVVQ